MVKNSLSVYSKYGPSRTSKSILKFFFFTALVFLVDDEIIAQAYSNEDEQSVEELFELSLTELMDIVVTSSAKRPEPLANASSAIYAITQEDIRHSGATSIPEVLRLVPGLQVARIDANKWAVSSRGFNDRFANKLLVLVDGRSVYTPTFSGVRWNAQDVLLEDIERIEVIRGPGATLWGANAVNGVINIITKRAKDTQGGLVVGGTGTEEKGFGALRYGSTIGEHVHYRVYAKYFDRDEFVDAEARDTADQWDKRQGGFRLDWKPGGRNSLTVQGDLFDDQTGETYLFPSPDPERSYSVVFDDTTDSTGGNLITRWDHQFSDSADFTLQIYYDRYKRSDALFKETTDTVDIDLQNRFFLGQKHQFIWGFGYRFIDDNFKNSFVLSFVPEERDTHFYSGFLQDNITLVPDRFHVILGSKVEHNAYTGFEFQPNFRFLVTPSDKQSFWGAISRAVRTPSRVENDGRVNDEFKLPGTTENPDPATPALVALFGSSDFESEELLAYELGYRIQGPQRLSLDVTAFYNVYDDLRTLERDPTTSFIETVGGTTHRVVPAFVNNNLEGKTHGVELIADWIVKDWWRITASYTYLKMQLELDSDSRDQTSEDAEGESPQQQASLLTSLELIPKVELDIWFRFVDRLPTLDIEQYSTIDMQLAWKPTAHLRMSVVGQNLFDSRHPEFESRFINSLATETQRAVYGKIEWHF